MTRTELDESFLKYYDTLIRIAKRKYHPDYAADLVHTVYVTMRARDEFMGVTLDNARSWWIFKVRELGSLQRKRAAKVKQVEQEFYQEYEPELTAMDGQEIIEEYWQGLPRYSKTRIRQEWAANGMTLLPFMEVKRRGRSCRPEERRI